MTTTISPLARTIREVIETDIPSLLETGKGKKAFQLVKHVTGKRVNTFHADYEWFECGKFYLHDTVVIKGKRGFVRVSLEPLFEVVNQ